MDRMTKNTACQLYEIIDRLSMEDREKLPDNILRLIEVKIDGYRLDDKIISIDDIELTDEAKKYLGYIFLNYLANEDEKTEYQKIIFENEERYQADLRKKYDTKIMFQQNKIKIHKDIEKPTELAIVETKKWWNKIIDKFKRMIKK